MSKVKTVRFVKSQKFRYLGQILSEPENRIVKNTGWQIFLRREGSTSSQYCGLKEWY